MKITKKTSDITFKKVCYEDTFEINGKTVRVNHFSMQDNELDDYDDDYEINESDAGLLTDQEFEFVGENLTDIIGLEIGKSFKE